MKKLIIAVVAIWALVIAAVAVTAVVLLRGSGESPDEAGPTSEPTEEATEQGDRELEDFYAQEIDWEDCGAWDCGWLEVPVDYADPSGATIELKLARANATGPEPVGSLVVNPGGPGGAGTAMIESSSWASAEQVQAYYFEPDLLAAYDVVGFDPRGTGGSAPIDCVSDAELDEYMAASSTPENPTEVEEHVELRRNFWQGCQDRSGDLLAHVSTVATARDMDVLRAALGEEQLHYLGFSYGTTLGATYASMFPDNVGRFVLDSATDPELDFIEDSLSQAEGFENALRNYVGACVDDGGCVLGDDIEEGLATIVDLLAELKKSPIPTHDLSRDLTDGYAETGIAAALYQDAVWSMLTRGLDEAINDGNGSTLLLLADNYASREADGSYSDNIMEAFPVIRCLDDPSALDIDEVPNWFDDFADVAPTLGERWAWGLAGCADFPVESAEEPVEIRAEGAAPILVIGVTGDPATPHDEAVAMAEQLASGVLLSFDANRHGAYSSKDPCVVQTVHALLIDGKAPEDTVTC